MTHRAIHTISLLSVALAFGGCFLFEGEEPANDDDGASTTTRPNLPQPPPACEIGQVQECVCFDEVLGTQACGEAGWGQCTGCVGVPRDWSCRDDYYDDGEACDCECGAPDPDCDAPGLPVYCFGSGMESTPPAPSGTVCSEAAQCIGPEAGAAELTLMLGDDLVDQPWLPESRIYLYTEEPIWFRGVRPAGYPAPIAGAWLSDGATTFGQLAPGDYWFDVKFIRGTGAFAYLKGSVTVTGDGTTTTHVMTAENDWASSEASWKHSIHAAGSRLGYVTVWTDSSDITSSTGGPVNDKLNVRFGDAEFVGSGDYISQDFVEPRCGADNGDTVRTYIVPEGEYLVRGTKVSSEWLAWGTYNFDVAAETCVLVRLGTHDSVDTPTAPPVNNPNGHDSDVDTYDVN